MFNIVPIIINEYTFFEKVTSRIHKQMFGVVLTETGRELYG